MLGSLVYHIRHAPAVYVARLIERRARRELAQHPALLSLLEAYREKSASTGASYSDYLVLYRWVRKHKPSEVLECGTGVTTVAIAYALRENHREGGPKGRVTSMEESASYFDSARAIFPQELEEYTDIVLSPAIVDHYHIFRGARYTTIPDRPYDFVFVDGPDLHNNPTGSDVAFNMDLVHLIRSSERPIAAIVDTRTTTCFVYSFLFPKTFRYDYLRKIGIVSPTTKHELSTPRAMVAAYMRGHAFKRPSIRSMWFGAY